MKRNDPQHCGCHAGVEFCRKVFDEELGEEWPLRGDIYFWNLLRAVTLNWVQFNGHGGFDNADRNMEDFVREFYRKCTGVPLGGGEGDCDYIDFIGKIGYGMLAGCLKREWWIRYALPELHRRLERVYGDCTEGALNLLVLTTDITKRSEDAIVCPTNSDLDPDGGVGGAIRAAAGPEFAKICRGVPKDKDGSRCAVGKACITLGGDLKSRFVIHTVAPNCQRGMTEHHKALLADCYNHTLDEAFYKRHLSSVAIPSIGTGKNAFPVEEAVKIAAPILVRQCRVVPSCKIVLCIPDDHVAEQYRAAIRGEHLKFRG